MATSAVRQDQNKPGKKAPMDDSAGGIRPETRALDALIEATIERSEGHSSKSRSDSMLFLGNRQAPFPALVVQDPVLEPVDKLVWMAIMLKAKETGKTTGFPSYDTIAKMVNVSSTATISRAIAILRLTRWLTLCGRNRERKGRFRGNVFALHDEPLPLVDVLHLDVGYMKFLRESLGHRHARVRTVARGVLESIDADIEAGMDVCAGESVMDCRIAATESVDKAAPRRFFAFSAKVMAGLRSGNDRPNGPDYQGRNLKVVDSKVQNLHPQNLKAVCCSSSYLYKTTTTTPTTQDEKQKNCGVAGENNAPLTYPKRLCDNQRELADRYLATVSAQSRQAILDEMEGRFRAEKKGMPPLYDEMSFLFCLCKALKNGEFRANLGIRVVEERVAREKACRKSPDRTKHTPDISDEEMRRRIEVAKGPLAEMRRALGMQSRISKEDDADDSP